MALQNKINSGGRTLDKLLVVLIKNNNQYDSTVMEVDILNIYQSSSADSKDAINTVFTRLTGKTFEQVLELHSA